LVEGRLDFESDQVHGLANELAQVRSDRAHAARFSEIADDLERLDVA
jgi:hypothetical protein